MLSLHTIASYVPDARIPVHELAAAAAVPTADARLLTRILGLDRVAVADGCSTLDMLLHVGDAALAGIDRSTVRYLIHAHTMPHVAPPGAALVGTLHAKLCLPNATAFALSHQGCTAGLYAVQLCDSLLAVEAADATALVLVGEKVPSPVARVLPGASMLGDAAAGLLVTRRGSGDAVIGYAHRTLGQYHRSRYMSKRLRQRYVDTYVPTMAEVMSAAVRNAGLELEEIALILPHNVNRFTWVAIARRLKLPISRVYLDNVPQLGHCCSTDPFLNLTSARAAGLVAAADAVVLVSAGEGATFSAMVVRTAGEGRGHDSSS